MLKRLPDNVNYQRKDMFKVAFNGIKTAIKEEKNLQFDLLMTSIVIICGLFFKISLFQWCILMMAISQVIVAEMLNTVVENIVDFICPKYHLTAKKIKDISAGMVLLSCIFSAVIGLIIFIPYVI